MAQTRGMKKRNDAVGDPPDSGGTLKDRFSIEKVFIRPPSNSPTKKETVPPPINIFGDQDEINKVKLLISKSLGNSKYVFKNNNNSVQLRTSDFQTYSSAKELLINNKTQCYFYSTNEVKLRKFVLYRLVNTEVGDIISDLNLYGLEPAEVKEMTVTKPKYPGHTNFLVCFNTDDHVSMRILEKVRYINHTVIQWGNYRPPPDHILTCRNCFRLGHGTSGCYLDPRCMICAKGHKTNDCPLIIKKRNLGLSEIPKIHLKCCNCDGNHTATDSSCPVRIKYLQKRNRNTTNRPVEQKKTLFTPAPPPELNIWEKKQFPEPRPPSGRINKPKLHVRSRSMSPRTRSGHSTKQRAPLTMNETPVINNKTSGNMNSQPVTQSHSYTKHTEKLSGEKFINIFKNSSNTHSNYSSNDLFSAEEAMTIFREVLTSIRQCRSREEQLETIMTIALKYQ